MNRPANMRTNTNINFAEAIREFAKTLYQLIIFATTAFIVGGKFIFDTLHDKFVVPNFRKRVLNERPFD